jgi:hypothetical protein
LAGFEFRCDGHPAQIREGFGLHHGVGGPVEEMVHHRGAARGGMDEPGAGTLGRVFLADQRCRICRPGPGITGWCGQRFVGDQFGLHHYPHPTVERLDLVADGADRPVHERYQPGRGDPYRASGR